jgi:hypothetical protein
MEGKYIQNNRGDHEHVIKKPPKTTELCSLTLETNFENKHNKKKKKLKHLPTSLPYCLSWQTSDLGLSEWEQLKLGAWLDLASQDQVTAASRSSKPVHPKHGHLVPTPGDWWPVPAVRAAKRRRRSCWMNRSHSTAESSQSPPQPRPIQAETRGRWSLSTNNPIVSFLGCLRGILSSPSSPVL